MGLKIVKLQNRDQAYAFYLFQLKERFRHQLDIRRIEEDLEKLEEKYNFTPPGESLGYYIEV